MFDVGWTEFLLVGVVALLVIGPKDLPKAMRVAGHWVGRMRAVARQFRAGFDNIVREAELEEMEKRWAEENARIMREHPASGAALGSAPADPTHDAAAAGGAAPAVASDGAGSRVDTDHDPFAVHPDPLPDDVSEPVFVEKPEIRPSPGEPHSPSNAGATS
ncbi:Sec-independent protein translocase protein TatB [Sphingomonas lenta]|uniref:Twin-arginine translocase subunit TatB n=1 Tax=Sphingomonas lenta TaxID=1141887 RepID=A0A2A2SHH9_9SPHN|nr:Sec-independent protein translocase protein TatB [Sphingomonas lenta]PAX08699.1 twin-arginine translocase subunit TatB [Sphingomonas lenta]